MAKINPDKVLTAFNFLPFEEKLKCFRNIQTAFYEAVEAERLRREDKVKELVGIVKKKEEE